MRRCVAALRTARQQTMMIAGSRRFVTAAIGALSLAAAPTFAVMALLTGAFGGAASDVLCSTQGAFPLSGMVPMYILMSGFHLGPWLKLMLR